MSKHSRGYFRDGTLPEKGTVCDVDGHIFDPDVLVHSDGHVLSAGDSLLLDTARGLAAGFKLPRVGS